jgi:antitoxin CptB
MTAGEGDRRRERLRWRCRRGLLELDLVLAGVFERHYDRLSVPEQDALEKLLSLEDPTLLSYVQGSEAPTDSELIKLLAKLRE